MKITDEMVEIALTIIFGPPAPPGSNSLTREFNRPSVRRTIEAVAPMLVPEGWVLVNPETLADMVVREACETDPADEDDPKTIKILASDLRRAALTAMSSATPPNTTRPNVATEGE